MAGVGTSALAEELLEEAKAGRREGVVLEEAIRE
jgi:hypothetical protein